MPKEFVHSIDQPDTNSDPLHTSQPSVKLGWSRESEHVQLAVVDWATDPDGMKAGVLHVQFDRYSINQMIRLLRRARDSAFGQDA